MTCRPRSKMSKKSQLWVKKSLSSGFAHGAKSSAALGTSLLNSRGETNPAWGCAQRQMCALRGCPDTGSWVATKTPVSKSCQYPSHRDAFQVETTFCQLAQLGDLWGTVAQSDRFRFAVTVTPPHRGAAPREAQHRSSFRALPKPDRGEH